MSWTVSCPSQSFPEQLCFVLELETECAIPASKSSLPPWWMPCAICFNCSFCFFTRCARGREAKFLSLLCWLLLFNCKSTNCLVEWCWLGVAGNALRADDRTADRFLATAGEWQTKVEGDSWEVDDRAVEFLAGVGGWLAGVEGDLLSGWW